MKKPSRRDLLLAPYQKNKENKETKGEEIEFSLHEGYDFVHLCALHMHPLHSLGSV